MASPELGHAAEGIAVVLPRSIVFQTRAHGARGRSEGARQEDLLLWGKKEWLKQQQQKWRDHHTFPMSTQGIGFQGEEEEIKAQRVGVIFLRS